MNKSSREGRNSDKRGVLMKQKKIDSDALPPDRLRSDTKFYCSKPGVGVHTCNISTQGPREKHQEFKANLGCLGAMPGAMCGGERSDNSQIERCSSRGAAVGEAGSSL